MVPRNFFLRYSPKNVRSALRRSPCILTLLIPLLVLFFTGLWGIDFGYHWDEKFQFILIEQTLESGLLIPGWYQYPSGSYWLCLSGILPHLLAALRITSDWHAVVQHLQLVVNTQAYQLQLRAIFLGASSLAVLWTGLQVFAMGRNWLEALAAASFLGLSWELAYHARWIAPDAVLMQFGALTMLFALKAVRQPQQRGWLTSAAIAAGFGCGMKYPGGLLILPVLVAAYQAEKQMSRFEKKPHQMMLSLSRVALIFAAAYLVTTPGTILDPIRFTKDIRYEMGHYQTGAYDQTVVPGLPHLNLILNYFARVFFSHYQPIAVCMFLLIIPGIYNLARTSPGEAFLYLSFPTIYILYFSSQRVMAARNLLVVAPFLALLAARGAAYLMSIVSRRKLLKLLWVSLLSALLLINAAWLVTAARSIRSRNTDLFIQQTAAYIRAHPQTTFSLSEKTAQALRALPGKPPENTSPLPASTTGMLVFYASEGMANPLQWPANYPGLAEKTFGPWEVNFDYYPLWAGDDRILIMPLEKAKRIGIRLVR